MVEIEVAAVTGARVDLSSSAYLEPDALANMHVALRIEARN